MQIQRYKKLLLSYIDRLNDVRFVGQLLFVVIVLLVSWSGIKAIQTNYGLQKQISAIKQQDEIQQLQNNNINLQNQYFNSNQYLELSARQNFGLAASGEKELLVSRQVALSHTVNLPNTSDTNNASSKQPGYQRNVESWVDFFLHRQNTSD
jgi:cell division protein FtsB